MRRKKSGGLKGSFAFAAILIAFLDLQGNMAATGLVTSMLATPHVNPPPKSTAEKRPETTPTALFYQLEWPTGAPHDLDIAVQCITTAPNGQQIVTNVNWLQVFQGWLRLSKDDLGAPTALNVEKLESTAETRWVPPNTKCWANAAVYHTKGGAMPVDLRFLAVDQRDSPDEKLIAEIFFKLTKPGEEITLLFSEWNHESRLVMETIKKYPDVETKLIMSRPPVWGVQ